MAIDINGRVKDKAGRGKRFVRIVGFLILLLAFYGVVKVVGSHLAWTQNLKEMAEIAPPTEMEIVRDEWGVPTIYGRTDPDTAYGLAYAHAEDDFATLEERLAIVRRELGSMRGKSGAEIDFFAHLIDARSQTQAGLDRVSPEGRAMAAAYADGINRFVADHPDEVTNRSLFPVTDVDIIEGFVLVSPLFFGLDQIVGDLVEGRNLDMSESFGTPEERGSNAFLLNGNRMEDGSTVLISNSHQPWFGPVAWYEARVASGEGWSFQGVTFPGVPVILMGHNEHLGWTNTVNRPDMVDVYQLDLDESGTRYRLDGEWRDLERRRVWLRVKMGPVVVPVPRSFERSVHGPVLRNEKGAFAFRYASEGETRHLDQYYGLVRTTNLAEWQEVMAMQAVPGTNFFYADKDGNIGFLYNAAFPKRDANVDWSGVLPGDRSDLIWEEYEPAGNIPFLLNPESGFIYNANNSPFDATLASEDFTAEDFPELVGIEDRVTNRGMRAEELLSADESITMEELLAIKMDTEVRRDSLQGEKISEVIAVAGEELGAVLTDWDWRFDGMGAGDAAALFVLHEVWPSSYFDVEAPAPTDVAAKVEAHLMTHFQTLDPPLRQVLRLRRGRVDVGLTGGPGVLRAIHSNIAEDGRLVAWNGDSYIMIVQWIDGVPRTQTIMAHGAAVDNPNSPHHADQVELFRRGEYKPSALPTYGDRP